MLTPRSFFMAEILTKVIRGETLESVHRGHLVVVEGTGNVVAKIGDPETITFWRSAAKSFQTLPCLLSGAADEFGFTEKEIALACASHSGEKFHTETAASMLKKAGLTEKDLSCGAHPSFHEETAEAMIRNGVTPNQLNNNCSGKHAAMLAFAKHIDADLKGYLSPENPVQEAILDVVSLFSGVSKDEIRFGTDGCSAPNFALPLKAMARAFVRLANPDIIAHERNENARKTENEFSGKFSWINLKDACKRIITAQTKYPEYVGGSVRLDTKIMQALNGKLVCKVGAEGVWCVGILPCEKYPTGLGIALKIEDGDDYRARPAAAIELLRQLGVMTEEAEKTLNEFSPMILKNRRDLIVGHVEADFKI